jgi:hypothetical protein
VRKVHADDLPISVARTPFCHTGIASFVTVLVAQGFLVQERAGCGSLTFVELTCFDFIARVEGGIGKGHMTKAQEKDQGEDEAMDTHLVDVVRDEGS